MSIADRSSSWEEENVPAAASPASTILSLQIGVVVVVALYFAREVLVPITVAVLLSFVLSPLVNFLRRLRLGRIPSVLIAVLFCDRNHRCHRDHHRIPSHAIDAAPEYAATIEKKVLTLQEFALDKMSGLVGHLGHDVKSDQTSVTQPSAPKADSTGREQPAAGAPPSNPLALLEKYLSPVLSPFATFGIILVVAIFVLLQKEDLRDRMIRLFGSTDLHRTTVAMDDAAKRLSRYFLAQLGLNSAFGLVIGVGLYFIGVPNPILWSILSALLRFVPYIGSFISAGLPIALATAVDPGWSMAIWTAALYVVVELL